jgi:DNA-binding transcriptional LysR family regulator
MYEMILSGAGIGVLEEPACVEALADGRLVRILPEFEVLPFDLNVLTQAQRPVPPRVRTMVTMLRMYTSEILERVHVDCGVVTNRVEVLPDDEVSAILKPSLRA